MFNTIEKHQKLVKGLLIALGVAFAMWGVGGYLGMSGYDGYVAKVGSQKIYPRDIDRAAEQNPKQATDKMQILLGLINRQLLINNFNDQRMLATTAALQHEIASIPAFQENGSFSVKKYTEFLSNRFMSAEQFQDEIGQQVLINQTLDFFKNSYFSSKLFDQKLATLLSRERNVSTYTITPQQFYPQIKISQKEINDYYSQNTSKFSIPEKVKLQYVALNTNSIANTINISDAEINTYIHNHPSQAQSKQVDVSHILFAVPNNANSATKSLIKAKAQKVLAMVRRNPSSFAALAKQYSEDPGSAKNGGDLGFFGPGVMVKPFDKVAFSLKKGQISDLVETPFGYHILKLNALKSADTIDLRKFALSELQKQKATAVLQEKLEQLNSLTYNNPNSLQPAAQKLGLSILSSDWINKGNTTGEFANPKILKAIFTPDVIQKHNNSEVVDLGDGSYAVYRVVEHVPAIIQPLAEVQDTVVATLKSQSAADMIYKAGQQDLALLQNHKLQLTFTNPTNVNLLAQNETIDPMAIKQIFNVSLTTTPAYTGAINANGAFVIYKINGEVVNTTLQTQNEANIAQFNTSQVNLFLNVYINYLRGNYSISYRMDQLSTQQQP